MQPIPVAFFEERYWISPLGLVINKANNKPLTPIKNSNGYFKVGLACGDGTYIQKSVHVLVAEHFIPNPYKYTQINHKDGNKSNNNVDNLHWCSPQQNIEHAFKIGLRPGYMPADDKEMYLQRVLSGEQVGDIAQKIGRRPETLHKMLRETAKRLGIHSDWVKVMEENRTNAAIRNLNKINS